MNKIKNIELRVSKDCNFTIFATGPCDPDPCNGHGICTELEFSSEKFNCTCDSGYYGTQCSRSKRETIKDGKGFSRIFYINNSDI